MLACRCMRHYDRAMCAIVLSKSAGVWFTAKRIEYDGICKNPVPVNYICYTNYRNKP